MGVFFFCGFSVFEVIDNKSNSSQKEKSSANKSVLLCVILIEITSNNAKVCGKHNKEVLNLKLIVAAISQNELEDVNYSRESNTESKQDSVS